MDKLLDLFLHLDERLITSVQAFGPWIYVLLFLVVFCETGLIIFPFLPGDSLLFAAGLVANPEHNALNMALVCLTFTGAAILGDSVNFCIGKFVGDRLFRPHKSAFLNKVFNPDHLLSARSYFSKYGPRTVVVGRFIPIVRTLTPFVAGQTMDYKTFLFYSIFGTFFWVGICCGAGYLFGQIPIVKEHFSTVLLVMAGLSIVLAIWEVTRSRKGHKKTPETPVDSGSGQSL